MSFKYYTEQVPSDVTFALTPQGSTTLATSAVLRTINVNAGSIQANVSCPGGTSSLLVSGSNDGSTFSRLLAPIVFAGGGQTITVGLTNYQSQYMQIGTTAPSSGVLSASVSVFLNNTWNR
jgi:hypothetical protein